MVRSPEEAEDASWFACAMFREDYLVLKSADVNERKYEEVGTTVSHRE